MVRSIQDDRRGAQDYSVATLRTFTFNAGRVVSAVYIEWQLFKRIDTALEVLGEIHLGMAAHNSVSIGLRYGAILRYRLGLG